MSNHRQTNRAYIELIKALQENEGAECEQVPEVFFPQGQNMEMLQLEIRVAKQICERCPVIEQCTKYGLVSEEPYGIWGGLTPAERNTLRRRR